MVILKGLEIIAIGIELDGDMGPHGSGILISLFRILQCYVQKFENQEIFLKQLPIFEYFVYNPARFEVSKILNCCYHEPLCIQIQDGGTFSAFIFYLVGFFSGPQ